MVEIDYLNLQTRQQWRNSNPFRSIFPRQDTIAFRDAETVERLKPLYDAYGNESLAEGASIYDKPSGVDLYDDDYDSEDEQNASTPLSPGLTEQQVDNDER